MKNLIVGIVLSFIGYLPPGNLNLQVIQMSSRHKSKDLIAFIIGICIAEFFYSLFVLHAIDWLHSMPILIRVLDWSIVPLFIGIAVAIWFRKEVHANENAKASKAFAKGLFYALFNPLIIPYWFVWGAYLISNHWIQREALHLTLFASGTVIGAFICMGMYAYAGKQLLKRVELEQKTLNRFLACVLFGLALYQGIRLLTEI